MHRTAKPYTLHMKFLTYTFPSTAGLFELHARKNDPIERIVPVGTHFTYECCGNNSKLIFRWGLYVQGLPSPSRLFSRVEVNMTDIFCSVSWASDFKASGYLGRIYVEYDPSSQCVQWILPKVIREDENTFIAVVRDNFTKGGKFRDCTPVLLKVSKGL